MATQTYVPDRHKLTTTLKWAFHFRVTGVGSFPLDMLRYDSCFPLDSGDATRLDDRERRTVCLVHYTSDARWSPTARRWESFGWRVIDAD